MFTEYIKLGPLRLREFLDDIINSVWYIALKYGVDEKHGKQIEKWHFQYLPKQKSYIN